MIQPTPKPAHECTNIDEVRSGIDYIDRKIINLLAERFDYVREVVKYKEKTTEGIVANERRNAVLATRREWAEAKGLSPDVIEDIYTRLIAYFIEEEKKLM